MMLARFYSAFTAVLAAVCVTISVNAQDRMYFVDGFHGGVYGHYPLKTYTDYMADQLEAHPEWSICLEIEPETWDSVAVHNPGGLERLKALAMTPRVEFTNPSYAQSYMYTISGESIIRQFRYGMDKVWKHFPQAEFLTYAVEEPCFTSALPMVLSQFGFKYASIKCPNTCWGGYSAGFGNGVVEWTSADGSHILAVPRYSFEKLGKNVWETEANGRYPSYIDDCEAAGVQRPVGMCFQDAGWTNGPWLDYGGASHPGVSYLTWRQYFEGEPDGAVHDVYHMSQEDVLGGLVWGSQILQRLARQVREAENEIVMTEKTGALLGLSTGQRLDQSLIDEAWRTLLLSQHHDCWIVPYNRLNKRGNWAENVALWTGASLDNCGEAISRMLAVDGIDGSSLRQFGVVNTAAFPRQETVSADIPEGWPEAFRITGPDGAAVPYIVEGGKAVFKASAPALGIASYTFSRQGKSTLVTPIVKTSGASDGPVKVNVGAYILTFSPSDGGVITSLRSKEGVEYVDLRSGQALGQLAGWFMDDGCWHSSTDEPATVEVSRADGILTKITVRGTIASVPFSQIITVGDGSRRIDFDLKIDWKENKRIGKFAQKDAYNNRHRAFYDSRYDLNVLFPVTCENPTLFKDAPFDVCESALENTYFDMWDDIKHNVILDWVDLCGKNGKSLALLSDHTTSYTYGPDFPLALTVQFSGNGLWGRNYSITRPTEMRFAIVPHAGKWDEAGIQEENQSWTEPLRAIPGAGPRSGVMDLGDTGLLLSALQSSEDGYLLRLYNAGGDSSPRKIRLGIPAASVREVNLLGQEIATPFFSGSQDGIIMEVSIPRFGIKTFKINK